MILGIECLVFCLIMFLICRVNVGNDVKNLKSFRAYPDNIQEKLKNDPKFNDKIKTPNDIAIFISNLFVFLVLVFIFGIFLRTSDFVYNFVALLILGEVANLFDFLIIDALWWRNSKLIRFSTIPDKSEYKSLKNHAISFVKGAIMFFLVALIDGAILITF